MKYVTILFLALFSISAAQEKEGFIMPEGVRKITIPFEQVSNMILIDLEVNGVPLEFVLDTGASRTSILNLTNIDSLTVGTGNEVKISGYGKGDSLKAIYSMGNTLSVNGYTSTDASIYVLAEEQISLVPLIGREVNGVLGADFFINHVVELNFERNLVTVYRDIDAVPRYKRGQPLDLTFSGSRPYLLLYLNRNGEATETKTLVDSGSGDSLWIFADQAGYDTAQKSFQDYLGLGVQGDIYGTRTKINHFQLEHFAFENMTVAFPDSTMLRGDDYDGSRSAIGNEVLRRFTTLFDYAGKKMYLRDNEQFREGFFYNMLGINVKEGDRELITEIVPLEKFGTKTEHRSIVTLTQGADQQMNYKYVPKITVTYVNPGSLANRAGIEPGDEIIQFNNRDRGNFNLNDIYRFIYGKPYTKLALRFKRGEREFTKKFKLKPIIE